MMPIWAAILQVGRERRSNRKVRMSGPELTSFLNQKIDVVLSAFPQWRFDRYVVEDDLHENVPQAFYYTSKPNGIEFLCDADVIVMAIFVHSSGKYGFGPYRHPVSGVEFSWDRTKIRGRFGVPSHTTEASSLPGLGRFGPSDRYDYPSHLIHFEFHPIDPCLNVITIMASKKVLRTYLSS
jgi:hypothetical protein